MLATFQDIYSHMLLVATLLDSHTKETLPE